MALDPRVVRLSEGIHFCLDLFNIFEMFLRDGRKFHNNIYGRANTIESRWSPIWF